MTFTLHIKKKNKESRHCQVIFLIYTELNGLKFTLLTVCFFFPLYNVSEIDFYLNSG